MWAPTALSLVRSVLKTNARRDVMLTWTAPSPVRSASKTSVRKVAGPTHFALKTARFALKVNVKRVAEILNNVRLENFVSMVNASK